MTNKEWLDYLAHNAPDELAAWFDAEHVETEERALDGDTEPENEDSRERLEADVFKAADDMEMFYNGERFIDTRKIIGWLDRQAAITERETKMRELYKFEENHREHIRSLEEVNRKLNERISELQSQSDEKWNLYVAERGRADSNAADREMYRETTTVLMDCITDGLREVNAILDGKDEGLA